jgi:hypothetical protein
MATNRKDRSPTRMCGKNRKQSRVRRFLLRGQSLGALFSTLLYLVAGPIPLSLGQGQSPFPPPQIPYSLPAANPPGTAPAFGSPQQLPVKSYKKMPEDALPIIMDSKFRSQLQEIQLFMKEGPLGKWSLQSKVTPDKQEFVFRAPQDGEYWFTLVTIGRDGRASTTNLDAQPPQAIAIVDQRSPLVQVQALNMTPEGQWVRCEVADDNLDSAQTQFEYQTADSRWHPVNPVLGAANTYCIPRQAQHTGLLRVIAADRAGNNTNREMHLQDCLAAKNPVPNIPDPAIQQPPLINNSGVANKVTFPDPPAATENAFNLKPIKFENTTPKPFQGAFPANSQRPPPNNPKVLDPILTQPKEMGIAAPVLVNPTAPATPAPLGRTVKMVNSPHVVLNYQVEGIGASGLGKVEIWVTLDQGQTWQQLSEDHDKTSPIELNLQGEGLFGLSLVATNGRGFGGKIPDRGDSPDWYIEVDSTPPQVSLHSVKTIQGNQPGMVLVTWSARDKNLTNEPIDLYYATQPTGPWTPIAKNLRNEGEYRWLVPQEAGGHVYVRMAATDKANNVSEAQTMQPVLIDDLSRPRIVVTDIETVPATSKTSRLP